MAALLSGSATAAGHMTPDLEFAVENTAGLRIAAALRATRVELCAALGETGGITPSPGIMQKACESGLSVHILVRPRPGGFTYSPDELDVIERDVVAALRAGAAGIVVGALAPDGAPDTDALHRLSAVVHAQKPDAEVTFHRAFDAALAAGTNPAEMLEQLARSGINRVLTSGGRPDCTQGLPMLTQLVELAKEHAPSVQIMAGGGVTLELVPRLVEAGVHAVHTSGRRPGAGAPASGVGPGSMDAGLAADIAAALRN
ncbi:copper homeostasis protein CutC [Arthrobacter sp. Soil736]|uniref:copper homeostasis protein CutC n=1 Tax=Arthrobacter sp. Soil736 TaxID=1736395 RepID=UPI001F11E216|nr:copper homeostasis protein CutC [Arthrobacter sp. Soil736]